MRIATTIKFAVRSLARKKRRTLLSVIGVGVSCTIAIFMAGLMAGSAEMRIRGVADSGFGHLRIAPAGWQVSRDNALRLADTASTLAWARAMGEVKVAAPHARVTALLAFGTRVAGVEIVGVDPPAEAGINRLVKAIAEGRYLAAEDRGLTVIGRAIAERLDVELDDELFLTVARQNGEMESAMLRIVGIIETGSREIDGSLCHVVLSDIERLTGLAGAGEISLTLHRPGRITGVAKRLRNQLTDAEEVLTWQEVLPGIGGDARSDQAFNDLLVVVVVLVVILGITSAQLTAILERKREFAVLIALGMKATQVMRLVFVEAAAIGLLGAVGGLLMATPLLTYFSTEGLNFAAMLGEEMSISGVLYDPVLYADMGPWMIPHALFVALISTLIAAVYPAWYAVGTDPTSALSLRET